MFRRTCYYCQSVSADAAPRCRKCGTRLTVLDRFHLWRQIRRKRRRARRHRRQ
ncbi:MAG TPA: hypothetical protein VHB98_07930 [Chloroflexota bacterium]|nr:hypothetical protein [Chloroflexota bacterium]